MSNINLESYCESDLADFLVFHGRKEGISANNDRGLVLYMTD